MDLVVDVCLQYLQLEKDLAEMVRLLTSTLHLNNIVSVQLFVTFYVMLSSEQMVAFLRMWLSLDLHVRADKWEYYHLWIVEDCF